MKPGAQPRAPRNLPMRLPSWRCLIGSSSKRSATNGRVPGLFLTPWRRVWKARKRHPLRTPKRVGRPRTELHRRALVVPLNRTSLLHLLCFWRVLKTRTLSARQYSVTVAQKQRCALIMSDWPLCALAVAFSLPRYSVFTTRLQLVQRLLIYLNVPLAVAITWPLLSCTSPSQKAIERVPCRSRPLALSLPLMLPPGRMKLHFISIVTLGRSCASWLRAALAMASRVMISPPALASGRSSVLVRVPRS